jgi:hypothetical protein
MILMEYWDEIISAFSTKLRIEERDSWKGLGRWISIQRDVKKKLPDRDWSALSENPTSERWTTVLYGRWQNLEGSCDEMNYCPDSEY